MLVWNIYYGGNQDINSYSKDTTMYVLILIAIVSISLAIGIFDEIENNS
jgi:hypothetical protein